MCHQLVKDPQTPASQGQGNGFYQMDGSKAPESQAVTGWGGGRVRGGGAAGRARERRYEKAEGSLARAGGAWEGLYSQQNLGVCINSFPSLPGCKAGQLI